MPISKLQLYRKVRSLAWRRKIAERLEELESEIMDYLLEQNSSQMIIAGYALKLSGKKLLLEKVPYVNQKQLRFYFTEKKGQNHGDN